MVAWIHTFAYHKWMQTYSQLDPLGQISMEFYSKYDNFHPESAQAF